MMKMKIDKNNKPAKWKRFYVPAGEVYIKKVQGGVLKFLWIRAIDRVGVMTFYPEINGINYDLCAVEDHGYNTKHKDVLRILDLWGGGENSMADKPITIMAAKIYLTKWEANNILPAGAKAKATAMAQARDQKRDNLEKLRVAIDKRLMEKSTGDRIAIGKVRARNHKPSMKFTKEIFAFEILLHGKKTGWVALREGFRNLEFYLRDNGAGVGELQPQFKKSGSGGLEPRGINFASARDIERVARLFVKYMGTMRKKPRGYV